MLDFLKSNIKDLGWTGVVIVMVTSAWLAQGQKINKLSLELGELRSDVKHMNVLFEITTKNCSKMAGIDLPEIPRLETLEIEK